MALLGDILAAIAHRLGYRRVAGPADIVAAIAHRLAERDPGDRLAEHRALGRSC